MTLGTDSTMLMGKHREQQGMSSRDAVEAYM